MNLLIKTIRSLFKELKETVSRGILMLKEKKKKQKSGKQRISQFFIPIILVVYISISHVFLPLFKKDDFLLFFQWNMYSSMPAESVRDITWDEGKTFLFRDHRKAAKKAGIKLIPLLYLLLYSNAETLKNNFHKTLLDFCNCKNLNVFKLKGSLSEHVLYKRQLKVLHMHLT